MGALGALATANSAVSFSVAGAGGFAVDNKVKLIVWDLDDTFWEGTLAEGGIVPIDRNIELVKTLAARGIIHSICSKNNESDARTQLVGMGIYDYFVFPKISFEPKGQTIAQLIEEISLRPENVLFIDDNWSNLQEVRYYNPGIMAAHPADILEQLLEHPNLAGKPDYDLARLKQYKLLERKAQERRTTTVSNEGFLRGCRINVSFDYDVEANFERVLELINRSNQLNYTKIRIELSREVDAFRASLREFAMHAGCVRATDRYGDYGLIGFYLLRRRDRSKKLLHFVFSCRTMHMGIEQHVYEKLGRPEIDIVGPVSYGLNVHQKVDWIEERNSSVQSAVKPDRRRLVLLGGCELLQLATYCSRNRLEFVNKAHKGIRIRYDDPGFILSDRKAIRECTSRGRIPIWTHRDAMAFDRGIAAASIVIISMAGALRGRYFRTRGGVQLRLTEEICRRISRRHRSWFGLHAEELSLDKSQRLALIIDSFRAIGDRSPRSRIFVLGTFVERNGRGIRAEFNRSCRSFCEENNERFEYVDITNIVPAEHIINGVHFDRQGYLALATHILERFAVAQKIANGRAAAARRAANRAAAGADAQQVTATQVPLPVPTLSHNGVEQSVAQPPFRPAFVVLPSVGGLKNRVLRGLSWWVRQNLRMNRSRMGLAK